MRTISGMLTDNYLAEPPLELNLYNEEILHTTGEAIRNQEGFVSRDEWAANRARRMR